MRRASARRREIEELSQKYGLDVQLDKLITEISVGEQQRTEILKALYHGAELLILDEPSAALTDIEVEGLFAIMKKLVSEGKSITRCVRSCISPTASRSFASERWSVRSIGRKRTGRSSPA